MNVTPTIRSASSGALVFRAVVAAVILALTSGSALALPPDPQRPFTATDCDAALARLEEARLGSPLISASEGTQVLRAAQAQALRLCGSDHPDILSSDSPDTPAAKGE